MARKSILPSIEVAGGFFKRGRMSLIMATCALTFEVRRAQRRGARPGLAKMYAYRQTGPGATPLGLASTEGLGHALSDRRTTAYLSLMPLMGQMTATDSFDRSASGHPPSPLPVMPPDGAHNRAPTALYR